MRHPETLASLKQNDKTPSDSVSEQFWLEVEVIDAAKPRRVSKQSVDTPSQALSTLSLKDPSPYDTVPSFSTKSSSLQSLGSARLAVALLQNAAEAFQNVPYIKVAAGIALQIIDIADEIRTNKERSQELIDKVTCYSRIIFEALYRSVSRTQESLSDLREDLLHIEHVLKAIHEILRSFTAATAMKRIRRVLQRSDILARIQELDRRLDTAVNSFQLKCAIHLRIGQAKPISNSAPLCAPRAFRRLRSKPQIMFGRDQELEKIIATTVDTSPARITILGTGGIGKTSLALSTLHDDRVVAKYGDARLFVSCEAATSVDHVLSELASALQVPAQGSEQVYSSVMHALRKSPCLLVLDNFETPWDMPDVRADVEGLLADITALDNVAVIVTLRGTQHPAGVRWSQPLLPPLQPVDPNSAASIFQTISGKMDTFVLQLVTAVDCVPLAVTLFGNLAAVEGETPEALWHRWKEEHTAMVERGDGDRLTNLDYSIHVSLSSPQIARDTDAVQLLSLLSLLPDGVPMGSLASFDGVFHHLPSLKRPVATLRKSALVYVDAGTDTLRILSPIRLYMQAHHPPAPEARRSLQRHYTSLALRDLAPDDAAGQQRFKAEAGNIEAMLADALRAGGARPEVFEAVLNFARYAYTFGLGSSAALALAVERLDAGGDKCAVSTAVPEPTSSRSKAMRLLHLKPAGMWTGTRAMDDGDQDGQVDQRLKMRGDCLGAWGQVLSRRCQFGEAEAALQRALACHTQARDALGRAGDLHNLGWLLSRDAASLDDAEAKFTEASALHRGAGDAVGEAYDLMGLGHVLLQRLRPEAAQEKFRHALEIHTLADDVLGQGAALNALGHALLASCKFGDVEARFSEALARNTVAGDVAGQAGSLTGKAIAFLLRSRFPEAQSNIEAALAFRREAGDVAGEGDALHTLARIYSASSRLDLAVDAFTRALEIHTQANDEAQQASDWHYLGRVYFKQGKVVEAEELFARAAGVFTRTGRAGDAADVLASTSLPLIRRARLDEAEAALQGALHVHESEGANVLGLARDYYGLGCISLRRTRLDDADAHLQRARDLCARIGNVQGEADAEGRLAEVLLARQELDAAARGAARALALHRGIGDVLGEGDDLHVHARIFLAQKQWRKDAEGTARAALRCHVEGGAPYGQALDLFTLAMALINENTYEQYLKGMEFVQKALSLFLSTEAVEEHQESLNYSLDFCRCET